MCLRDTSNRVNANKVSEFKLLCFSFRLIYLGIGAVFRFFVVGHKLEFKNYNIVAIFKIRTKHFYNPHSQSFAVSRQKELNLAK